jgi:transposase
MLSKEAVIVLQHYLQEGLSKTAIARKLGVTRRTVQRYAKSGKTAARYGPRPPRPAKLDPYVAYLRERLTAYPELSAVRLLAEVRPLGFTGGYTAVKDFVRRHRPRPPVAFETRFEVAPGDQAQVDFATFQTPFGTVYALLVVLSWSRLLWVKYAFQQDELTVLGGLHQAFVAFGGVPRTVLFDRMKTAVVGAEADGTAIFNAELQRFATHCGFAPRACRPYRAKTKGRVERAVAYLRDSFFYGRTFRDLADLNAQCATWLGETANARAHATTHAIPAIRLQEEQRQLRPLPREPYVPLVTVSRRITRDGFISYNGNDYSVPDGLTARAVDVRATLTELRLFVDERLIATHPLLEGRGARRLTSGHRSGRHRSVLLADREGGASGAPPPARVDVPGAGLEVERRALSVYEQVLQ